MGAGRRHWKLQETRKLRMKSGSRKHCNALMQEQPGQCVATAATAVITSAAATVRILTLKIP